MDVLDESSGKQEIENLAQLLPVAHQNEAACAAGTAPLTP